MMSSCDINLYTLQETEHLHVPTQYGCHLHNMAEPVTNYYCHVHSVCVNTQVN